MPQRNIDYVIQQFGLGNVSIKYDLDGGNIPSSNITSYLGTPVFGAVVLRYEPFNLEIGLRTVLCEVSMTKNIVKTPMQGVDGTIKEYISDGDYSVTIKGAIVSNDNSLPEEGIKLLHQLCLVKDDIAVENEFLQLFDIYNIVIESYSFPEQEGYLNMQLFELQCISDKPIQLIIEDETLN